ncbi:LuxR C-terminal-related transcriptional regulator [Streptomyces sp. NPDC056534]|uniref:helix-turn-helix transcriptional regulator n=1 Tax=Streptomyces sp. NPDC056534 TaxID=3345857 RepID=UPI0036BCE31B
MIRPLLAGATLAGTEEKELRALDPARNGVGSTTAGAPLPSSASTPSKASECPNNRCGALQHSAVGGDEGSFALPVQEVELVGRQAEVTRISHLLAQRGHHSGVMLVGASGVGKTRLAAEVLKELACDSEIIQVIATFPDREHLADLERLTGSGIQAVGVPAWELRQALDSMRYRQRGAVLFVDDAHLLEPAAAALVLEVAQRRTVRMLLTMNTEEPPPIAITMLWKDDHLHRIDLGPLDTAATRRLVAALSGQRLAHKTATSFARLSQGNPQLLRELIRAAVKHRLLEPSPAGWVMRGPVPLSLPLCELVTRRIARLMPESRETLERIALAEPVMLPRLEKIATQEVLLHLEDEGFIHVASSPAQGLHTPPLVQVSHPLISHAIFHGLPLLRRRAHLEAWLEVFPKLAQCTGFDAVAVAGWLLETGTAIDADEILRAAQCAEDGQDLEGAARLTAAAWCKAPSLKSASAHARALIALADFTQATDVLDASEAAYPRASEIAEVRARSYLLQGRFDDAESVIALLPEVQRRLYTGMAAYFQGMIDTALELCGTLAEDPDSERTSEAAIFYVASLLHAGRPQDALTTYRRFFAASGDKSFHSDSYEQIHAVALADLGRLAEAAEQLEHAHREAVNSGRSRFDAQRGLALGAVLLERGRPYEALNLLTFHPAYQVGWPLWHDRAQTLRSLAAVTLGQVGDMDLPDEAPSHFMIFQQVARAWSSFLKGNREHSAALLIKAAENAIAQGAHAHVAIAVHEMARIGLAAESRPYWITQLQGPYLNARLNYARALATEDIMILRRVAEAFADSGAELYAAEAYAELSRLLRRAGQGRAATGASRRAKELADRCEGATTPALWLLSSTEPLTSREQELVTLVAQGLSDKEIAQQLTLSVRTVSNHMYRVYRKLGITNRRALQQQAGSLSAGSEGPNSPS